MCVIWGDDKPSRVSTRLDVGMIHALPTTERVLVDALAVFVFDSSIRAHLLAHDPKAYQQAVDALVDFGVLRVDKRWNA